jgi:medium-chain acyl-[acyl-carrier-protein] hydrolase
MRRQQASAWFIVPRPIPAARLRLFCLPYAGGGAATYSNWHARLPSWVEVIAVQPPGRGQRIAERPYSSMDELVDNLITNILPLLDRPYVLFGHSLGSRVAYELMRRLDAMQLPLPERFVASGSRAPHICRSEKIVHDLPHDEFVQELRDLNGTPEAILENAELMELLVPLLRADFGISEKYRAIAAKRFGCRAHVLGGQDDSDVSAADLASWQDYFVDPISLQMYEGDHFFLEKQAGQVLHDLNLVLRDTLRELS